MKKRCTCVIPCYNEASRISQVLQVVTQTKSIDEIICVDDGSTDQTSSVIKINFPQVKIIRLTKNQGKTDAVRKGVQKAKGNLVFLLDADLSQLKPSVINSVIKKMIDNPQLDLIILRDRIKLWWHRLFRLDVLISGQRILSKKDLSKILKNRAVKNYRLELAINQYMMENKKEAFWFPDSLGAVFPHHKLGFFQAARKELLMYPDIIFYVGFLNFIKQILFFCKQEVYRGTNTNGNRPMPQSKKCLFLLG